jgi:hypothetical protein
VKGVALRQTFGTPVAISSGMTNPNRKLQRSEFMHSLDLVWPTNQLRKARLDFWGAVAMVCAIGLLAKFAQSLLS